MKCPFCNFIDSKVLDTRSSDNDTVVRRRRMCINCGKRFTTYERVEEIPLIVVKRNGEKEIFDRNKIINGIMRACHKRPITMEQIEQISDDVENAIEMSNKEMSSEKIGEMVMESLKEIDEVAYVRFASVYREFKDVSTFIAEIDKLLEKTHLPKEV